MTSHPAKTERKTKIKSKKSLDSKALAGSAEARRHAVVILEVLSGLRGPVDGSQSMGVSLTRYYALETRALQGLIGALEPLPRGRQRSPEDELHRLGRDKRRLERELARAQALLRAAQRSIGLQPPVTDKDQKKRPGSRRRRRPVVRAMKAIAALRTPETLAAPVSAEPKSGTDGP